MSFMNVDLGKVVVPIYKLSLSQGSRVFTKGQWLSKSFLKVSGCSVAGRTITIQGATAKLVYVYSDPSNTESFTILYNSDSITIDPGEGFNVSTDLSGGIQISALDVDSPTFLESVQDIVGGMLTNTDTIHLTYNDSTGKITADYVGETGGGGATAAADVSVTAPERFPEFFTWTNVQQVVDFITNNWAAPQGFATLDGSGNLFQNVDKSHINGFADLLLANNGLFGTKFDYAATGTTQATGTILNDTVCSVVTADAGNVAITLPTVQHLVQTLAGLSRWVVNLTSETLTLFPSSGEGILGKADDEAIELAPNDVVVMMPVALKKWCYVKFSNAS
jgi:hypothetical protein